MPYGKASGAPSPAASKGSKGTLWDATEYGSLPRSAKKFYTHWMQRCARAATLANARHMLAQVDALKARASRLAVPIGGR